MTLRDQIIAHEGRVPHAYQDHLGYWTIGVGHLIDSKKGGRLPDKIIDALLDHDIEQAHQQLDKNLSWWRGRSQSVQDGLTEMVFQLGMAGVLDFKRMLACLHAGDYEGAKREALDSKWAKQDTPERAKAVVAKFVP